MTKIHIIQKTIGRWHRYMDIKNICVINILVSSVCIYKYQYTVIICLYTQNIKKSVV